ncbi:hypothetical protein MRB53_014093 [Persea americana]|uniref:Uncharacterized protein n=1 Tax=Persea americana TaxID=3435 RepID=A0ACC2K9Z5_PERAE|nr:hypothetical protein MRB53_014093 [Persea americana]
MSFERLGMQQLNCPRSLLKSLELRRSTCACCWQLWVSRLRPMEPAIQRGVMAGGDVGKVIWTIAHLESPHTLNDKVWFPLVPPYKCPSSEKTAGTEDLPVEVGLSAQEDSDAIDLKEAILDEGKVNQRSSSQRLKGGIVQFDITEVPPAVEVKENVIPDTTPKAAQDADLKSIGKPTRKFVFRTAAFIDPSPPCPG